MSRAARRQSDSPVPWRLLTGLACYFFLSGVLQSLVSLQGQAVGLSGFALGIALGLVSGGFGTLTDLPFAGYSDSRNPWRAVALGFLGSLVASMILLFFHSGTALLLGSFLFGLASSAMGNALLSWLSSTGSRREQNQVQGLNGSIQRGGALFAAAVLGLAIFVRLIDLLALSAISVAAFGFWILQRDGRSLQRTLPSSPSSLTTVAVGAFSRAFHLLRQRGIILAAITTAAINVILLVTNSYVPLVQGRGRAGLVAGALAARDVAAIVVGLLVARRRSNSAAYLLVATSLALAGTGMWLSATATPTIGLVAACGVEGAVMGFCIAATNLFTIDSTAVESRTVGMAASIFPTRILFIVLPIVSSQIVRAYGLSEMFRAMGVVLLGLATSVLLVGGVGRQRE